MKENEVKELNEVSINTSTGDEFPSEKEFKHIQKERPTETANETTHDSDFLQETYSEEKDISNEDTNTNTVSLETEDTCKDEINTSLCNNTGDKKSCTCDDEKVSLLEAENKRLTDEILRVRAEMENSKRRHQRFLEEKSQEKNKQLLLDIIDLLDNFERAMSAGENSTQEKETSSSAHAVVQGIKMIEEKFLQTLSNKWGLKRYNSVNLAFDPSLHEAMMKEYSDKVSCETVTEEFMKGYMFYEKVLRPAKVKVAVPKTHE